MSHRVSHLLPANTALYWTILYHDIRLSILSSTSILLVRGSSFLYLLFPMYILVVMLSWKLAVNTNVVIVVFGSVSMLNN